MDVAGRAPTSAGLNDTGEAQRSGLATFGSGRAGPSRLSYAAGMTWTFWRVYILGGTAALLGWIGLTTVVQQLGHL